MYRWFLVAPEGVEHHIHVPVEGPVELSIPVVEVPGLPDLGRLVAGCLERLSAHGVLYEHAALGPSELGLESLDVLDRLLRSVVQRLRMAGPVGRAAGR